MRLRKQKEVQKENEFYMQLLQQALPPEQQMLQRQEKEAEEGKWLLFDRHGNKLTLVAPCKQWLLNLDMCFLSESVSLPSSLCSANPVYFYM